jgi:hypothetical protein
LICPKINALFLRRICSDRFRQFFTMKMKVLPRLSGGTPS